MKQRNEYNISDNIKRLKQGEANGMQMKEKKSLDT